MTDAELDAAFAAAMTSSTRPPRSKPRPPAARRRAQPAGPELEFQRQVVAAAEQLGLRVFWIPSMARTNIGRVARTARGWPDLVIAGERGVLFRELKTEDGSTAAEQDMWLWLLHHAGLDAAVWRPADWHAGLIRRQLEAIAA